MIRRTASERRRRSAWRSLLLDRWHGGSEPLARAVEDPETEVQRSEREARILRALASLSRKQRGMLELVAYHDLTVREAAEVLGLRLGTARTHYQRGKQMLRRRLSEEGDLDD